MPRRKQLITIILLCLSVTLSACVQKPADSQDSSSSPETGVSDTSGISVSEDYSQPSSGGSSSDITMPSLAPAFENEPDWPIDNSKRPISQILGATYWGSRYIPDLEEKKSGMQSAADALRTMGTKVVKLSLDLMASVYPFDEWASTGTIKDILMQKPMQIMFDRDFSTYFLVAVEPLHVNWSLGLSDAELNYVKDEFYQAARYLIEKYQGTGKTFVFQNWEADNMLSYTSADSTAVKGMIDYFNARQDGVEKAQKQFSLGHDVYVYNAVEVNRILLRSSIPKVIDDVVPYTHADLYLYSSYEKKEAYDVQTPPGDECEKKLKELIVGALDQYAAKAPDSKYFGSKNIAISEFGYPETIAKNQYSLFGADNWQKLVAQVHVDAGREWGAQYIVYWELYCNELMDEAKSAMDWKKLSNDDMKGFWLIRPDGSFSKTYDYFKNLFDVAGQ